MSAFKGRDVWVRVGAFGGGGWKQKCIGTSPCIKVPQGERGWGVLGGEEARGGGEGEKKQRMGTSP